MSSTRVKFIAYFKNSTSTLVEKYCNESGKESTYNTEATKIFVNNIKKLNLVPEERQKMSSSSGSWFCTTDDKDICYLVLTDSNYPERLVYAMISELQKHLEKLGNYEDQSIDILKKQGKPKIKELAEKYDDVEKVDKLIATQQGVNEVANIMTTNLQKMLKNQEDLGNLSVKADNMRNQAHEFKNQSTDLAKIMYWRNLKLKIILGIIVLAAGCYIIVPIVSKFTS